jgi:hypothetical protein
MEMRTITLNRRNLIEGSVAGASSMAAGQRIAAAAFIRSPLAVL